MSKKVIVKRGDIYYADLSPVVGSEQGGVRPVLIIQNDVGNKYSPTVIAAAITSQINKAKMPTHIELSAREYGLNKDSVILLEQIRTIDKKRLREKTGRLDDALILALAEHDLFVDGRSLLLDFFDDSAALHHFSAERLHLVHKRHDFFLRFSLFFAAHRV